MGGNARLADAHHGMLTAKAFQRRAAAAGQAFIARLVGVVKIGAASALQKIARRGGLIAQLAGGPGK
ncbi:hypothetical protein D3C75_1164170 [compost metagenome]